MTKHEETEALPPLHWGDVAEALGSIRAENDWAHTILSGIVDDYLKVRQFKSLSVRETLPENERWKQVANHAMRTLLRDDESLMYGHGGPRCKTGDDLYAAMYRTLPPETGS